MDAGVLPVDRRKRLLRNDPKIHQKPVEQTAVSQKTKNQTIKNALKETRLRRRDQVCKQYELKIDQSHLNFETVKQLPLLFLEAKWLYNDQIASGVFAADYKNRTVRTKVGDHYENRTIKTLSSQMRQELIDRTKDNVHGLSALKKNGYKVGALKFKRQINSIPLKQYGITYRVDRTHNRIGIQGIGQKLRVRGLEQIPAGAEFASALLLQRPVGIYLHLTTYQPKTEQKALGGSVGTDTGIKEQVVLSNGVQVKFQVPVTKKIRRAHRELSGRRKHGRNWNKTRNKLSRAYDECTRQKRDIRNKIVHGITTTYDVVCVQNDNVSGWQRMWGRRIQATAIGGLTSALQKKAQTPTEVPRFYPSTKTCSKCGATNNIVLTERIYHCTICGLTIDRNMNAATNIKNYGVPAECRELTPEDTKTSTRLMEYLNSIPQVHASLVEEPGSPQVTGTQPDAHDFSHG